MARRKQPSNAVLTGGALGTSTGTLIELAAAAAGLPLPVGTGAALTGLLTAFFAWKARGGRKGEPD